jgi:hypothetical protein
MSIEPYISQHTKDLLNLHRLPARLDVRQVSALIGFTEHDVAVLARAKLLRPLGNPAPNAPKYFAAVEIKSLADDREWLSKATTAIARHWRGSNQKKSFGKLASV